MSSFASFQLLLLPFLLSGGGATVFTLHNNCSYTVWPGVQPGADSPMIGGGGMRLAAGKRTRVHAPSRWSGRIWPRRGCAFDAAGRGSCLTGGCGDRLDCAGAGGEPPVTLAEITLGGASADFYDVSLVDGYNAPVSVVPTGPRRCVAAACAADVNRVCPAGPMRVVGPGGEVVACKSACMAFGEPEYCCTGTHATPDTCGPTEYSRVFKGVCPAAYSYAYDDPTSIFQCRGVNYTIRFC